jgi:hypothetical protein
MFSQQAPQPATRAGRPRKVVVRVSGIEESSTARSPTRLAMTPSFAERRPKMESTSVPSGYARPARAHHPNIVQVSEVGEFAGRPYFSQENCPGGSLADRLRGGPLPPEEPGCRSTGS